jgi:hypothetical protein
MRNHSSGADFFVRPSDCIGVTFRNRLVIRFCGQSCSISRADRQVLPRKAGRPAVPLQESGLRDYEGYRGSLKLLTLAYCIEFATTKAPGFSAMTPWAVVGNAARHSWHLWRRQQLRICNL